MSNHHTHWAKGIAYYYFAPAIKLEDIKTGEKKLNANQNQKKELENRKKCNMKMEFSTICNFIYYVMLSAYHLLKAAPFLSV